MELLKGKLIHVGVAEWRAGAAPDAARTTLGSCVGIVLYSSEHKIGGLAHALLAEPPAGKIVNRSKYARTAIEALVAELKTRAPIEGLKARLFGGASMFEALETSFMGNIGTENVRVARETLERLGIPVLFEDVGGHAGRSITVYFDDGRILLRHNGTEKYVYKA